MGSGVFGELRGWGGECCKVESGGIDDGYKVKRVRIEGSCKGSVVFWEMLLI